MMDAVMDQASSTDAPLARAAPRRIAMAMPVPPQVEWTAAMARALPDDGNRYEVVDGELLVTPAPSQRHQRAMELLHLLLGPYARASRMMHAHFAPCEIEFSPTRAVQPDLFVVRLVNGKMPPDADLPRTVLLVVEGLSPTTARYDRRKKRPMFQKEGVPEFWIVDIDARVIERWRPADDRPEVVTETLVWKPFGEHPPLVIDVNSYFAEVWEDG
jgi:Uma2 family endonuclease